MLAPVNVPNPILCIAIKIKKNISAIAGAIGFFISLPKKINSIVAASKSNKVNAFVGTNHRG